MHVFLKNRLNDIYKICKDYKVKKLYTFGSVNTDMFNEKESDIDLIVELEPMEPIQKGELLIELWDKFEGLFQRKVDLLTNTKVRNPYLQTGIDKTIKLLYEA